MAERNIIKSQVNILGGPKDKNVRIQIVLLNIILIFFSMIIACLLLNFLQQNNCENRLVNKVFMICCMTWAPTAGRTPAQSGQWNVSVMAPNTQRLHQRLGHINRTLHADIEKTTSLEKKH